MATLREIAIDILPHMQKCVLEGMTMSYGYYAEKIGRSAAKEAVVIGQAMHLIGAACVLAKIPIVPLQYIKRESGNLKGIFERDVLEKHFVLPHYDNLKLASRLYTFTERDFLKLNKVLADIVPKHFPKEMESQHELWKFVICNKRDNDTYFECALREYNNLIDASKSVKFASNKSSHSPH